MSRATVNLLAVLSTALLATTPGSAAEDEIALNRQRFAAAIAWTAPSGQSGVGHPVRISDDTAYFWFFDPGNVELIIKVLDARGVNGHHWVFYGALSNVEYTITVTDTATGAERRYFNPAGRLASVGDTEAFSDEGAGRAPPPETWAAAPPIGAADRSGTVSPRHGQKHFEGGPAPPALSHTHCEQGRADVYGCKKVALWSFVPLSELGAVGTAADIWGWTDPQSGREIAIVTLANGTAFVDVTTPDRPVHLGNLPSQTRFSVWRDAKTYQDHVFVVADDVGPHGMQVFDLRRLRQVTNPPVSFEPTRVYGSFGSAHNLAINEETGFAYAVGSDSCAGGLHMVDISRPAIPRFAGCFTGDGYTHDVQCVLYRGQDARRRGREICFASNEDSLTIVDVTDKVSPQLLSRRDYQGRGYTHQAWLTEDHRFLLLDDEGDEREFGHRTRTYIWDVGDLDAPAVVGTHTATTTAIDHNIYTHRGLAFQANYTSGLRILDLAEVERGRLQEIAYFDIVPEHDDPVFGGAWSVYPYFASGNLVLSGSEQGLYVFQPLLPGFGEPAAPSQLAAELEDFAITLGWQNNCHHESGLRVYRRVGEAGEELLAELPAGSSSYVDRDLISDTVYRYRVVAFNVVGESGGPDVVVATPTLPTECTATPSTLCLQQDRFLVEVAWSSADGDRGEGQAGRLGADSGLFWFFTESNVELVVKILDGDAINGHHWLFYGALSNVEYTVRVVDTREGRMRSYSNPQGEFASVADIEAFPGGD